jgi:hypothetical protein
MATLQLSIPNVPLSTTGPLICGLAIITAAALSCLIGAICGERGRRL